MADERAALVLYKLGNLCRDRVQRPFIIDNTIPIEQFIDRRNGQLIGMHMHPQVMQNTRQVLQSAQVASPAGGNACE